MKWSELVRNRYLHRSHSGFVIDRQTVCGASLPLWQAGIDSLYPWNKVRKKRKISPQLIFFFLRLCFWHLCLYLTVSVARQETGKERGGDMQQWSPDWELNHGRCYVVCVLTTWPTGHPPQLIYDRWSIFSVDTQEFDWDSYDKSLPFLRL